MQNNFNHKKLILDANADCDPKAGGALWGEQMAPLQGDDQPPDSTFYECYIFASEQKQTPFFLFFEKKKKSCYVNTLQTWIKTENLMCQTSAALDDFYTTNSF